MCRSRKYSLNSDCTKHSLHVVSTHSKAQAENISDIRAHPLVRDLVFLSLYASLSQAGRSHSNCYECSGTWNRFLIGQLYFSNSNHFEHHGLLYNYLLRYRFCTTFEKQCISR